MLSHWKLDAAGSPHYTCRTLTSLYSQEMIRGRADKFCLHLTLILLTWRIWWVPNNASRWQTGFNSAFKGL